MFNGDTLLATVDQQLASGVATGTAKTRYVHPDHLGSTNVVTDENDNVVQTLDYYPYGATRVSVATSTNEKRKWIDRFSDDSGLSYLNARYYNPTQGQFVSQDPAFWGMQNAGDPQRLNAYAYGRDNPIALLDTSGWDSAYFAARPVLFFGRHIYEAYSVDSQLIANQLNIGLTVPNNVSSSNPFNFTIGFEPSDGRGFGTGTGSSLTMSVESGNGSSGSWNGDYRDASANGFTSNRGQLSLGNYKNYAALANASVNIGGAISSAGNPYFGLGDNLMRLIATRNYYNSNGAIGTVARGTGQGAAFNQFASGGMVAPGKGNNVPTNSQAVQYSGMSQSTPMMIGNSQGPFVGTYNFGSGVGTYNFGTKSWK
jgi:RHS repeat-associated protein